LAVVVLVVLLIGFVVVWVRSAQSDMVVRIGKIVEIRRGPRDLNSPTASAPHVESANLPDDAES